MTNDQRGMRPAIWRHPKRKRPLKGHWEWIYAGQYFLIELDKIEPISGRQISFRCYNDTPEWDGWKREQQP